MKTNYAKDSSQVSNSNFYRNTSENFGLIKEQNMNQFSKEFERSKTLKSTHQ